jgi:hypothetical protein
MQDFTKTQKVIRVGNSYAVTLDSKFVNANNLQAGDQIVGSYSQTHVAYAASRQQTMVIKDTGAQKYEAGKKLTKTEQKAVLQSKITPEFIDWIDKTLEEDREALEELANL